MSTPTPVPNENIHCFEVDSEKDDALKLEADSEVIPYGITAEEAAFLKSFSDERRKAIVRKVGALSLHTCSQYLL